MSTNSTLSSRGCIPIEVLELCLDTFVLGHGATRDTPFYQTLLSCALSSRALLPRSRHHIYSRIRLSVSSTKLWTDSTRGMDATQQSSRTELLCKALTLNPSLAGCIRTLELDINSPPPMMSPAILLILETIERHLRAQASSQSQSSSESPHHALGPGLQELALIGESRAVAWSDLPEAFLQRISELLSVPNPNSKDSSSSSSSGGDTRRTIGISRLRLSHLSAVPVTLLSTSTAPLRHLSLQTVFFAGAEQHAPQGLDLHSENGALSAVEELTSYDCGARLAKALCGQALDTAIPSDGAMFSRLTRLQVWAIHRQDVEWGAAVVKANAGTLQTLEVGGFSQGQAQYASTLCSQIDLRSLPLLTHLVVTTHAASTPSSPVCPFALLNTFDFARAESASASLRSIEINVRCMFRKHTLSSLDSILKPEDVGAGINGGGIDCVDDSLGYPKDHNSQSDKWTPTFANPSIKRKFQLLSHLSINMMLGLGLTRTDKKEQGAEGRMRTQLNGYLGTGIEPLKQTGVTAKLRTEITLFDTV